MLETVCHALRMSAEDLGSLQLDLPPLGLALAAGVAPEPGHRHFPGVGDLDPHLLPLPLHLFHLPLDSVLGCHPLPLDCHPFLFPFPLIFLCLG